MLTAGKIWLSILYPVDGKGTNWLSVWKIFSKDLGVIINLKMILTTERATQML